MADRIINIYGRAQTGASRPFLCEDGNGQSYFVKRCNVTWEQLVYEYVFGSLASQYGIPVAPFAVLEIPELLARQTLAKDRQDFQPGLAFASQRVPFAEDLRESHLRHVPLETKIAVFCFDWWTRNSDRRLSLLGGSPNLLWDPMMQGVVAIDHDQVLDPDFDPDEFKREHAFREVPPFIEQADLDKLRTKFESAIYNLDKIWSNLPGEWLREEDGTDRLDRSMHDIEGALLKPTLPVDGVLFK